MRPTPPPAAPAIRPMLMGASSAGLGGSVVLGGGGGGGGGGTSTIWVVMLATSGSVVWIWSGAVTGIGVVGMTLVPRFVEVAWSNRLFAVPLPAVELPVETLTQGHVPLGQGRSLM